MMSIPTAATIDRSITVVSDLPMGVTPTVTVDGPFEIHIVDCLNDLVAVQIFQRKSDLALPDSEKFSNEGIVIGIGPGLPDNNGNRVPTQLKIGDVVSFVGRNGMKIQRQDRPDDQILLIPERSLLCRLSPVPFVVVK